MNRTKTALFALAESHGIGRKEFVSSLREAGIEGSFDPKMWDEYLGVLLRKVVSMKKDEILKREAERPSYAVTETVAEKATRALKAWGRVEWLFYPIKKTPDGQYVKDPRNEVEGELVYPGVRNE